MGYKVKTYIPTLSATEYTREITNFDILNIIKYIKANDDYGLSKYFEHNVVDCYAPTLLDKFFIIIQLRALNFNNRVTFKGKHATGSDAISNVDLFKFLGDILIQHSNIPQTHQYRYKNLIIDFKLPTKLYFKNIYSLLLDTITGISYNNVSLYKNKSEKEKLEILVRLKNDYLVKIKEYLQDLNEKLELFLVKNEDGETNIPTIRISFYNNTLFNILKSIFKLEITYFYQRLYTCITKLGLDYNSYMRLTYVETDILLSIYKSVNKLK